MSDSTDKTKIAEAPAASPSGLQFPATMIVVPRFKLITRNDGAVVLEADPPGDGKGAQRIEVPAELGRDFLHFLSVSGRHALELRRGP